VLRNKATLIKDTVMKYRSSQKKDSGGGGGGGGRGMFEWYTGVVQVRVIVENNSGSFPHMFAGASFLVKRIHMHFCPGVHFGFASSQPVEVGPSSVSLFMKLSMSDVSVSCPAG
jgi:hypothetical protein